MIYTVIVKNPAPDDAPIPDLGLIPGVPGNGQQELCPDEFTYIEIASSRDLKSLVENEILIVNDGENDLSATDGLNYITLQHSS